MNDRTPAPPLGRRSRSTAKPIGAYLPKVAKAAFQTHGFPTAALLSEWPAIAGRAMAAFTAPERLIWPRRSGQRSHEDQTAPPKTGNRPTGATLVLRVDGPRAIEVQHGAPQIIEKVNTYFGYRAVATLRIVQGPVARPRATPQPSRQSAQHLEAAERSPDEAGLERIDDGRLRDALARLASRLR